MKLQKLIQNIEKQQLKTDVAPIRIGDTVKVWLIIQESKEHQLEIDVVPISIGNTLEVASTIEKGEKQQLDETGKNEPTSEETKKQRIQPYEGTVIAQHRAGLSTTITVRRIFKNIGVERVFSIHSPLIKNIEIIRQAKVRKAKLYYLRASIGKSTRLKERFKKSDKKRKVNN